MEKFQNRDNRWNDYENKKVLNSSVILAIDENNKEFVCLGKGIGYNKKNGDIVEKNSMDQIFMPVETIQIYEYLKLLD